MALISSSPNHVIREMTPKGKVICECTEIQPVTRDPDTPSTPCFYIKGALSIWTNFSKRFVVRVVMSL